MIYILINCLKLSSLRQKLYKEVREAFNNITLILEGKNKQRLKKLNSSAQCRAVNAVLDFTEASLRFQSRVARGP
jgi:hypothetical protein